MDRNIELGEAHARLDMWGDEVPRTVEDEDGVMVPLTLAERVGCLIAVAEAAESAASDLSDHADSLLTALHRIIRAAGSEPADETPATLAEFVCTTIEGLEHELERYEDKPPTFAELYNAHDIAEAEKARADRAEAELQWQVRPADAAVSTDGERFEALHVPSGVRAVGSSRSEALYECQRQRADRAEKERDVYRTALARALSLSPVTITVESAQSWIDDWEDRNGRE